MTTPISSDPTPPKQPPPSNPTNKNPPKSILKKPRKPRPEDAPIEPDHTIVARAKASQTALQHAKIIQDRKQFEVHVLDCIIRLCELPEASDPPYSAGNASESDAAEFKALVRVFQPGDFDDLVEERNVGGLCGYPLCGRARIRYKGGQWKIHNNAIVKKAELEKWCSGECARRAMYVKVQLNETGAWERVGIPSIQIDLMDEKAKTDQEKMEDDLARLELDDKRRVAHDADTLAMERESTKKKIRTKLDITIREKVVITPAEPPSLRDGEEDDDMHMMIEGYKLKLQGKAPMEGGGD